MLQFGKNLKFERTSGFTVPLAKLAAGKPTSFAPKNIWLSSAAFGMFWVEEIIMTGKTFLNSVANGETDIVQFFLSILHQTGSTYCVIGGLGVNAYAEPVVSLDLDLVVFSDHISDIRSVAEAKGMKVEEFEHSINLSISGSDLRIQLQTDTRYQDFLSHCEQRDILGYSMSVASLQDVLRGKVWA
ncbi:MAG: hypothetical protein Q7J98_01925, partial [Kiritimatiellia bacterium]|nr:hypothetical protein [Kiritimatiellia bacterium]